MREDKQPPILANILISAHDNQILLTATDLEVELKARSLWIR